MEDDVFPSPAVAELMKKVLIESRHHTDSQNTMTAEQFADGKAAQAEIAGTRAMPTFVIVDPHTGAKLDTFKLSGGFTEWEGKWKEWLEAVLAKSGRLK
jgi:hypothetical protein